MIVGDPAEVTAPPPRRVRWWRAAAVVLALLAPALWWLHGRTGADTRRPSVAQPPIGRDVPIPPPELLTSDPSLLRKVSPQAAMAINAAVPVAQGPNPAAAPFVVGIADATWRRSVDCLTAAIYYEAANEPDDGQRAVAQVVLNRIRHPIYPKTICGVVFEGHERPTGCQFSFTCDGSLRRVPLPARWDRARRVAAAALSGSTYGPVGWSTNYHASYVVPYWAPTLVKTAAIGLHIFYRLPGRAGMPGAFTGRYLANEDEALDLLALGGELSNEADNLSAFVADSERPILNNDPGVASPVAPGDDPSPAPPQARERWVIGADAPAPDKNRP